jgi:DNA-binding response OmpR family regulator
MEASPAASARILRALHSGCETFVLSAIDGQMSARVRLTIVDSAAATAKCRLGSASVTVDWSRSTIANGARRVSLSRTELRLFAALLEGEGQPISRAELLACVWRDADLADRKNTLNVYICSLRKRLESIGARGALQTVRGVGYRAVVRLIPS